MWQNKRREKLRAAFGKPPRRKYDSGEMKLIRSYYRYCREQKRLGFQLDATTWYDLDMEDVFQRLNTTQSSSGEQYLYAQLYCPAVTEDDYRERAALLAQLEAQPERRLDYQLILDKLGKRRNIDLTRAFAPSRHGPGLFVIVCLLLALLLTMIVGLALGYPTMLPLVLLVVVNALFHQSMTRRLEYELPTLQYAVGMVQACLALHQQADPQLQQQLAPFFAAGQTLRKLARSGGFLFAVNNELIAMLNAVLLLDLLAFEQLKLRLSQHQAEILLIHENLGRLDAAIAILSYRQSLPYYSEPELDFNPQSKPFLAAENLIHPLLQEPVPNSIETQQSLLLTGSNASGKSTFLKTVLLNAILAQSCCTALATSYRATACTIYSSLAVTDDIISGDSYYIAEIKSLKRILEALERGERVFCAVDEVLRGTNTVERIAASSELLALLQRRGALCLAATHDIELCAMLEGSYRLLHFQEQVTDEAVHFDYQLREGPAASRNAIKLLAVMGFEEELTKRANHKAELYLQTGSWEEEA